MFMRPLVVGVSLVALLGGEGWCGDPDRSFYTRTRARAAEIEGLAANPSLHKGGNGKDQTPNPPITHAQFAGRLPVEIWQVECLRYLDSRSVFALTGAVPDLAKVLILTLVRRELLDLQNAGILSHAVAAKLDAWVRSEKEKVQCRARLLCEAVAAQRDLQNAGILSHAVAAKLDAWVWSEEEKVEDRAQLLCEAIGANMDDVGTLSLIQVIKTPLNKALEKGNKPAIARTLMIWRHQKDFFAERIDGFYHEETINTLMLMSSKLIEAITTHAPQIFKKDMNGYFRTEIIKALAKLTPEKIADFFDVLNPRQQYFLTDEMDGSSRAKVILALAKHLLKDSVDFKKVWKTHHGKFITANMGGCERAQLVKFLTPLSPAQIEAVASYAHVKTLQLLIDKMDEKDRAHISATLAKLTPEKIAGFFDVLKPLQEDFLTEEMGEEERDQIILALAKKLPKDSVDFKKAWKDHQGKFIKNNMRGGERVQVILRLSKKHPKQIASMAVRRSA